MRTRRPLASRSARCSWKSSRGRPMSGRTRARKVAGWSSMPGSTIDVPQPNTAVRICHSICRIGCITVSATLGGRTHKQGIMTTQTIDVHAHVLTEETIRLLQREAPKVAPKLSEIDEQFGTLDVAGSIYRHFPRGGWDLDRRLADMAASKVDVQVLSVCPQTFVYDQPPAVAAGFARIQNEQLAKLVKTHPGPLHRHRHAADAGAQARRRRAALRDAHARPATARRSARTSPARISTIRNSNRSGRRRPSSAPSSWSIRSTSPAWTGSARIISTT